MKDNNDLIWISYSDGSGYLKTPVGKMFEYDSTVGQFGNLVVEYKSSNTSSYDYFYGNLDEFMKMVEKELGIEHLVMIKNAI